MSVTVEITLRIDGRRVKMLRHGDWAQVPRIGEEVTLLDDDETTAQVERVVWDAGGAGATVCLQGASVNWLTAGDMQNDGWEPVDESAFRDAYARSMALMAEKGKNKTPKD